MRRGNPRPSVAIDRRAQRPFEAQLTIPLNQSNILESAQLAWRSPSIETHSYTGGNAFVCLGIQWPGAFPPSFGLIGYLVQGLGTVGSPGPPSALSNGIPGLPGKAVPIPGTYPLPLVVSGTSRDRRHNHADSAWFELWAVGRGVPYLEVTVDGVISLGWSYS